MCSIKDNELMNLAVVVVVYIYFDFISVIYQSNPISIIADVGDFTTCIDIDISISYISIICMEHFRVYFY